MVKDTPNLSVYIPMDRRQALVAGKMLPDRVQGTALLADISSFTALTGALVTEYGRRRGAELVLDYINPIYDALIDTLYAYRGSVIGFAGDSITCWLEGDNGRKGIACALAMQAVTEALGQIQTPDGTVVKLTIKVGLANGPARRFLVGDPEWCYFDVLAGTTLARMAAVESVAHKGEVVVSHEVADQLGNDLLVTTWRSTPAGQKVAVVTEFKGSLPPISPWPDLPPNGLTEAQQLAWIAPSIYDRLRRGQAFATELRPAAALFLKFTGIDYDGDETASQQLDTFIRGVQQIVSHYEGFLIQLTIGDKGSYLYLNFGALIAHDDDAERAVAAALDLHQMSQQMAIITTMQIGISQGMMWTGEVGGHLRRTYGAMGEEVNISAQLMSQAKPGQTLVRQHVADMTSLNHYYIPMDNIVAKGKEKPIATSLVMGRRTPPTQWLSNLFNTPLVGREEAFIQLQRYLALAESGLIIRLEGEAGVGKSHLAAVFMEQAIRQGRQSIVGTGQSTNQHRAYLPWRQIIYTLLGLTEGSASQIQDQLSNILRQFNDTWLVRLPLLGDLLSIPLPDNGMTQSLSPNQRQQALFTLVVDIILAQAQTHPLLIVLDDVHWLDELSLQLTVAVSRAIIHAPICLLVIHRPPLPANQPILPELDVLSYYYTLSLTDLSPAGVQQLVNYRLRGQASPLLYDIVWAQAQGNPFFTQELVDTLREASYIKQQTNGVWDLSATAFHALLDGNCLAKVAGQWQLLPHAALNAVGLDIPDSVQGVVLTRIDRLREETKLILKVASVIGRTFSLTLLQAVHPQQPTLSQLQAEIEVASQRDFVHLEGTISRPTYIFRHNIVQEVAYGTLLFAQRRQLHSQVAGWYETTYADNAPLTLNSPLAPYYTLLFHHWHQAENEARERIYAALAGEQAAAGFANAGAIRYLSRALALTPSQDKDELYRLLLMREKVYHLQGSRHLQAEDLATLEEIAVNLSDTQKAKVSLQWCYYSFVIDDQETALRTVARALQEAQRAQAVKLEIEAWQQWGKILNKQLNQFELAIEYSQRAVALAQQHGELQLEGWSLYNLSENLYETNQHDKAKTHLQEALVIFNEIDDQRGQLVCNIQIAAIYQRQGIYIAARDSFAEGLALSRLIGWRSMELYCLTALGNVYFDLGDYKQVKRYYQQALPLAQRAGSRSREAIALDTLSLVHYVSGDYKQAQQYATQALTLQRTLKYRYGEGYNLNHLGLALAGLGQYEAATEQFQQALHLRRELGQEALALDDLAGLARVALAQGAYQRALTYTEEILAWLAEHEPVGVEFPVLVYLSCYQVLQTTTNGAALQQVLEAGYNLIQTRAKHIQDAGLRHTFLQEEPFNRAFLAAWHQHESSRE